MTEPPLQVVTFGETMVRLSPPTGFSLENTATLEMSAEASEPEGPIRAAGVSSSGGPAGRPIRTSPWPYIFIITLLCAEWIGRRRSGLR